MLSLPGSFFDRDPTQLAQDLVGKVLEHKVGDLWLSARIIETEAYYRTELGSHASLGQSPSRSSLWARPGTIYMYHSRGGDSLNFSAKGPGNAVLVKSGWVSPSTPELVLDSMHRNNPGSRGLRRRRDRLCSGQALLCRSLGLRRVDWDGRQLGAGLRITDQGETPARLLQAGRLGIREDRDAHLMYRFIDPDHVRDATRNPLTRRGAVEGSDYHWVDLPQSGWKPVAIPEEHGNTTSS